MKDEVFEVDTPNAEAVVAEIRKRVAEKREQGLYIDARVARAERANLAHMRDEDEFLEFYLESLRESVTVDISDFDIFERRARFSRVFVAVKRFVWKLLKFYTYRLWSQQNQVNGLLYSAIESIESRSRKKISELESRIAELEEKKPESGD